MTTINTPKSQMNSFQKWFTTFLEEKQLPAQEWEIEHNSETHFIDSDVVIEAILNCSAIEQAQIKNMIVKIDFANGDVLHFFKHLAHGLVASH